MQDFYVTRRGLKRLYLICLILFACLVAFLWQQVQTTSPSKLATREQVEVSRVNEPIQPIPLHINLDERKVKLGEKLFNDTRLSKDNRFSCASCHNLNTGGVDRRVTSLGINGKDVVGINTPTVFNSGFNFKQNWSGKFNDLVEQVLGSVQNPKTMGSNWAEVVPRLQKSPEDVREFARVYSNGINKDNIADAVATFEQSLYTPNSRFDRFLRGDTQALTQEQREGYHIFTSYGCVSCHQGVNVGGNMFQQFGVMGDYFALRGKIAKADLGRFNFTGKESDRYVFKVSSLRNIALTPPYFHDGSATTLKEAVEVMAKYQLGRPLTAKQVDLIVQFLTTLTGEYKENQL